MTDEAVNFCKCGCGRKIESHRTWVSGHNLKRRPKDAIVKNGRLYKVIKCDECEKDFERRSDQINRCGKVNLCSSKCFGVHNSKLSKGRIMHNARHGEYRHCVVCGKEYYLNPYRVENGNSKYCSQDCFFEEQRIKGVVPKGFISSANNRGENNGMYKHGKRTGKNATGKEKLRKGVIERDGDFCVICYSRTEGLHLHRVIHGYDGGKYEVSNCVQLCPEDHEMVHTEKEKWMKVLKEHIENKKL